MKRPSPPILICALIAIILAGGIATLAQTASPSPVPTPGSTPDPTVSGSSVPAASPTPSPPRVEHIIEGHLELDNLIGVKVANFPDWAKNNDPTKLVPYIDGRPILGNYPQGVHTSDGRVHFHLEITPENKDIWIDLLGEPNGIRKPVNFSLGLEGEPYFETDFGPANQLPLTIISPVYGVVSVIIVFFTLILLVWLARKTNLIREPGVCPDPGKLRPYNLGRTQMAFWFFLIYASYLTIWLITGALDTITASLLGLMGISGGTALGEALIDSGKDEGQTSQLQDLTAQKQSLEQSIPELQSQIDAINAKITLTPEDTTNRDSLNKQLQDNRKRLAQVNQQLETLQPGASRGISLGFLRDILSDGSGYSFHRFQIFAWTIVLGIIFVSSVYNGLSMPDFSPTLLGLMGLSSGTYLGFKFPEQK